MTGWAAALKWQMSSRVVESRREVFRAAAETARLWSVEVGAARAAACVVLILSEPIWYVKRGSSVKNYTKFCYF